MPAASDRFELLDIIGRGGMSTVWRARDLVTGNTIAVKLLHQAFATDQAYVARLEREIEVARRLDSPHIARVLGYGRRDGVPFIAMEYVDGPSLRDTLDERRLLPWPEARRIATAVAEALAMAHGHGIIHRDIKPSNILLTQDNRVKLADFGVARADDLTRLTGTATTLGTPLYMAPDTDASPAMDVYALGCVIYEMLAGTPPFVADGPAALLLMHERQQPDLSALPREARPIVAALMQKKAGKRPSAAATIGLLSGAAVRHPGRGLPVSRRMLSAGGGALLVAGLAMVTAFVLLNDSDGEDVKAQTPDKTDLSTVTPGPSSPATTSPAATPTPSPTSPPSSDRPTIVSVNSRPRLAWGETQTITLTFSAPRGDASIIQIHEQGHHSDGTPLRWSGFTGADGKVADWTGDGYIQRPLTASKEDQVAGKATYTVQFPCTQDRDFQSHLSLTVIRETPQGKDYSEVAEFNWTCSKSGS